MDFNGFLYLGLGLVVSQVITFGYSYYQKIIKLEKKRTETMNTELTTIKADLETKHNQVVDKIEQDMKKYSSAIEDNLEKTSVKLTSTISNIEKKMGHYFDLVSSLTPTERGCYRTWAGITNDGYSAMLEKLKKRNIVITEAYRKLMNDVVNRNNSFVDLDEVGDNKDNKNNIDIVDGKNNDNNDNIDVVEVKYIENKNNIVDGKNNDNKNNPALLGILRRMNRDGDIDDKNNNNQILDQFFRRNWGIAEDVNVTFNEGHVAVRDFYTDPIPNINNNEIVIN